MKIKRFIFIISALTLCALLIFSCSGDSGKWVAKIKNETITLDMFNSLYYAQQKQFYNESNEEIDKRAANPEEVNKNPTLDKRDFLESLIRQKLVYNRALEDGILKNNEVESLVQMAKETVVVSYYVTEKFKDQVEVTEQEISKVYSDQKAKFRNVPVDQAEQYIRQQLKQQKLQVKFKDFVETLKEEGGIKRNLDLLTKKDDSANKDEPTSLK